MKKLIATLALLAGVTTVSAAQSTVDMTFTNGGSLSGRFVDDGHYYVGDYSGTMDGTPVNLNCVDFFHDVSNGEVWTARTTNLATGNFSETYYKNQQAYQEAAYLTTFFPGASNQDTINIAYAIWRIVDGNDPSQYGGDASRLFNSAATAWMACAEANYNRNLDCNGHPYDVNYSQFVLLTDVNGSAQELLTATPEPPSVALLGVGFLLLLPVFRRRNKL